MFLKTAPRANPDGPNRALTGLRRLGGSMVLRMTAWYAGSSFMLILIATGVLYVTVVGNMKSEDRRILRNTAANLHYLLRQSISVHQTQRLLARSTGPFVRPQLIWIRVISANGQTVLETKGMDRALPISNFPALQTIPAGHDVIRTIHTGSGRLFQTLSQHIVSPTGLNQIFQVAVDRTNEQRLLVHYQEALLIVLIIALALCSAIGFAIARGGMRPVARIIRTTRLIRSSTLHERLDTARLPTELQSLAGTFNDMLDRLEDSFAQISQFSADVAHELRTPINNLRGEIEVALGKPRAPDEYRDVLGSALEECDRINRVIHGLLFLAHAETAELSPDRETLNVRVEIASILEFYEPAASEAGVSLTASGSGDLFALFDRVLFQQAIGNLVANALAHTPRGGSVTVTAAQEGGGRLRIDVIDTGQGIAPEHLPHVFDRFYRADQARSSIGGNFGLGLSVVKSIAMLHGGAVSIDSTLGHGTRVTLVTPSRTEPPVA